MLIVEDCIVSEDIADSLFCCALDKCKGQCCVEGDAGAPLEEVEIPVLQQILPKLKPYMTVEGLEVVQRQGVSDTDPDLNPCTPLVNGRECAFTVWRDGTAMCAIEQAYNDGVISFRKPVSCHLYPIRVDDYGEFRAVNYHRWDVCRCAVAEGRAAGMPLYRYLEEPLVRKFGREWYDELLYQIEQFKERQKDNK